jgi:hypothetical protein
MGTEMSLLKSQEPAGAPYSEPDKSNSDPLILFI